MRRRTARSTDDKVALSSWVFTCHDWHKMCPISPVRMQHRLQFHLERYRRTLLGILVQRAIVRKSQLQLRWSCTVDSPLFDTFHRKLSHDSWWRVVALEPALAGEIELHTLFCLSARHAFQTRSWMLPSCIRTSGSCRTKVYDAREQCADCEKPHCSEKRVHDTPAATPLNSKCDRGKNGPTADC